MAVIQITQTDRLKSQVAEAKWYPGIIKKVDMKQSKSQKSVNFWTEIQIDGGPLSGKSFEITYNTEVNNASILGTLQMKPYSDLITLIAAANGIKAPEVPDSYDTDDLIDKPIDFKVMIHLADGTPINIVERIVPRGQGSDKTPF